MWRLERRPDAGLDRDSLGGVLGDDGMTLLPRQLERVLSGTDRGSGSHRYQLPASYRQVRWPIPAHAAHREAKHFEQPGSLFYRAACFLNDRVDNMHDI